MPGKFRCVSSPLSTRRGNQLTSTTLFFDGQSSGLGRGAMDRADEANRLREDFLAGARRYSRLRHFLVWSPPALAEDLRKSLSEWAGWGFIASAGVQLVESHLFQFRGSQSDAEEAELEFGDCALQAWRWAVRLRTDVRPQLPHSHGYEEYLDWVDLLYLLGQDNRIAGLGVKTSWGEEESGMERKPTTPAGWQLLDHETTPCTRRPSLWEQSVVWTPSSKKGCNVYWTPRAWLQENLWYASAAAVGYLAEKGSHVAHVPLPAEARRGGEMTLTQVAEKWDVPKSALSAAAKKELGSPDHLPARRSGRSVFVTEEDAKAFCKNYLARREQRIVGSKSPDPEARAITKRFLRRP